MGPGVGGGVGGGGNPPGYCCALCGGGCCGGCVGFGSVGVGWGGCSLCSKLLVVVVEAEAEAVEEAADLDEAVQGVLRERAPELARPCAHLAAAFALVVAADVDVPVDVPWGVELGVEGCVKAVASLDLDDAAAVGDLGWAA